MFDNALNIFVPDEVLQLQDQLPAAIEGAQLGDPEGAYQAAEITGQIVAVLQPRAIIAGSLVAAYLWLTRKAKKRARRGNGALYRLLHHPAFKTATVAAAVFVLFKFYRAKKEADSWALAASDMAQLASQNQPSTVIET